MRAAGPVELERGARHARRRGEFELDFMSARQGRDADDLEHHDGRCQRGDDVALLHRFPSFEPFK